MSDQTLFEKIGGKDAVSAAVDIFYKKNLSDDRIKHFFDGLDMVKQKGHMRTFLTYAFGGLPDYPGKNMRDAHKRLVEEEGLDKEHFAAVAENLQSTLEELNVPADLIAEIMSIVASTHDDVLNL